VLFEGLTQVFVVRIWREPRDIPGSAPESRAHVGHINSGEWRYVRDLRDVMRFIRSHLGDDASVHRRRSLFGFWRERRP